MVMEQADGLKHSGRGEAVKLNTPCQFPDVKQVGRLFRAGCLRRQGGGMEDRGFAELFPDEPGVVAIAAGTNRRIGDPANRRE